VTFGFTTAIVPAAYLGAFLRGCAGATFYTLGATVIQQLSPADATGRVFGVSGMLGSVADTVALPAAGLVVAASGRARRCSPRSRLPSASHYWRPLSHDRRPADAAVAPVEAAARYRQRRRVVPAAAEQEVGHQDAEPCGQPLSYEKI
jgi:MFS family permease